MTMNNETMDKYSMIVIIVKKGLGSKVIEVAKKSGSEGGTVLFGKGIASKKIYQEFLGIDFDPEKEVILTLVEESKVDSVLNAVSDMAQLNKPGAGIAFTVDVKYNCGVAHLLKRWKSSNGGTN